MQDIKSFFAKISPTGEGWKANCPRCGDHERKFAWNTEKRVGCCFHSSCLWYYEHGGVTERRLFAFFGVSGVHHTIPEIIEKAEEADVSLPKEFKLIADLDKEMRATLYAYLSRRDIPKRVVDKAKLGYCESGERWGYIILPVFNEQGEVVYWQGRRFKNREPKFYNPKSSKKSDLVYCVSLCTIPKRIILVESVINALTLESLDKGNTAIIALLGKSMSEAQKDYVLCHERKLKELVVALDGDARRDTMGIIDALNHKIPALKIANIPNGEDINSLGREKAWQLINNAEVYNPNRRIEFMTREV